MNIDLVNLKFSRMLKSASAQKDKYKELAEVFRAQLNGKKDDQFYALKVQQKIKDVAFQPDTSGEVNSEANLEIIETIFKKVLTEELGK